jgi:hypothetical protein
MNRARSVALAWAGILALVPAGCVSRPADLPNQAEAIEQARREERQKVLQQYWRDRTSDLPGPPPASRAAWPDLSYPSGEYYGLRFGPRQAQDPSLAEPSR